MQLRLEQYNDNTTSIREAIASLIGCRDNEVANEAQILRRVLHTHRNDTLLRRKPEAIERRAAMVARAEEALSARTIAAANALVNATQKHFQAVGDASAKSLLEMMKRA
jgi:hypothetical protein